VFLLPLSSEDLFIRISKDSGASDTGDPIFPEDEWQSYCSFLQPDSESIKDNDLSFGPKSVDEALTNLESERQALELERQSLAEERERLKEAAELRETTGAVPSDIKLELKRQSTELEEQKIFLIDAHREVEAARGAWEEERLALEKSNSDLQKRLTELEANGKNGSNATNWLRNSIGALSLAKRESGHNLSPSDINELTERAAIATEARRGLEAELDEISRSAEQARTRQVELEQDVADLRSRYENTSGGGIISGGSLVERLDWLSESILTT